MEAEMAHVFVLEEYDLFKRKQARPFYFEN